MSNETKTCNLCSACKDISEFPKNRGKCKSCYNSTRKRNPENEKRIKREWEERNREKRNERARRWVNENQNKVTEYHTSRRRIDPVPDRARHAVHRAVKRGEILKSEHCQRCGIGGKISAHHEDYEKPLDVMWLCRKCHCDRHAEMKEAVNV